MITSLNCTSCALGYETTDATNTTCFQPEFRPHQGWVAALKAAPLAIRQQQGNPTEVDGDVPVLRAGSTYTFEAPELEPKEKKFAGYAQPFTKIHYELDFSRGAEVDIGCNTSVVGDTADDPHIPKSDFAHPNSMREVCGSGGLVWLPLSMFMVCVWGKGGGGAVAVFVSVGVRSVAAAPGRVWLDDRRHVSAPCRQATNGRTAAASRMQIRRIWATTQRGVSDITDSKLRGQGISPLSVPPPPCVAHQRGAVAQATDTVVAVARARFRVPTLGRQPPCPLTHRASSACVAWPGHVLVVNVHRHQPLQNNKRR